MMKFKPKLLSSKTARIDFNGLAQLRLWFPHLIDFFHCNLSRIKGVYSSSKSIVLILFEGFLKSKILLFLSFF